MATKTQASKKDHITTRVFVLSLIPRWIRSRTSMYSCSCLAPENKKKIISKVFMFFKKATKNHTSFTINLTLTKGQTKSKRFFQANVSSKKRTNKFYFTTMKPKVNLFSFIFWRKLKTSKRHFEIN